MIYALRGKKWLYLIGGISLNMDRIVQSSEIHNSNKSDSANE